MDRETYDRMRVLQETHWWFVARRRILADQIARLPLPADPRILEVGCGPGGNLDMLKRFGHVEAIEPDAESRDYAAGRAGVTVRSGLLPDRLPDFEAPFDMIAAFDVIEHVDDDAGAIRALGSLLNPGGVLVTTVPAGAWMWSRHDEHHHHKRRYALPAYRRLFEGAGLSVRRATHFNTLLFPPIAAVRLLQKLTRSEGGNDEAVPAPAINAALTRLFAAEAGLLRAVDLPFGVSILLIAERPA